MNFLFSAVEATLISNFDRAACLTTKTLTLTLCVFLCSCSGGETKAVPRKPTMGRSPLSTLNSGKDYMAECLAAGVPVPTTVLDSSWVNHGEVGDEFLSANLEAELWSWSPSSPKGLCLALPRWDAAGGAVFLGVICQGYNSSKVCFWDNQHDPNIAEPRTEAGNVGYPLTRFVGGAELGVGQQFVSGGMCSNCHAGANAFVVHPEKPAFVDLQRVRRDVLPTASGWYEPIVPAGWYQNERRERRLDAVPSTSQCSSCHNRNRKMELPELSNVLQFNGFCDSVLEPSVTRATETMPQGPLPAGQSFATYRSGFANHIIKLREFCAQEPPAAGGKTVRVEPGQDDPSFLSPPRILQPVFTCGRGVAVGGVVPNALVTLSISNPRTGASTLLTAAWDERYEIVNFDIPSGLDEDDVLSATQDVAGVVSADSEPLEVDDYPFETLPVPSFAPDTIYECANTVSVRGTPGSQLTIGQDGFAPVTASPGDGWAIASPGASPWGLGVDFSATAELSCVSNGVSKSWSSDTVVATSVAPPATLQRPSFEPAQSYAGQSMLGVRTVTYGAFCTISRVDPSRLGLGDTLPAPDGWGANFLLAPTPLLRPVAEGETFLAEPSLYCPGGPTGDRTITPPVRPCDDMPAPAIESPRIGALQVSVLQSMPGARIRIRDGAGQEVGDGSAPVVVLRRPVVAGDQFTATQDSGDCRGSWGFSIAASGG